MKSSRFGRKAALLTLLLAAALFLSGCNLIVKDPEVDKKQVILSINGEEVNKEEFTRYYNNAYDRAYENQQMMQQYGYPAQPIDPAQVLEETLDSTARDKLLHQKAHELGLDELTAEESAALAEQAKADYQDILTQVKDYYFPGTTLEGEELDKALKDKAAELGLSEQAYLDSAEESNLHEKLLEYAGRDIVISDEDIQAAYNRHIVEDKSRYAGNLDAYGQALSGGQPVYYTPAGYRYVRQILIDLPAEQQTEAAALESELSPLQAAVDTAQAEVDRYEELLRQAGVSQEDKAFIDSQAVALGEETARFKSLVSSAGLDAAKAGELAALKAKTPVYTALAEAKTALEAKQAEVNPKLDEIFSVIQEKTDEVYARATAPGADFDALVKEIGGDPAQPAEGYAVSEATTTFVDAFTKAAMALEKPGDISQPVRTNYGYHILRYVADIPEGEASLDSVREALRSELFTSKQQETYNALEAGWLAEADIQKYPDRFKD